MLLNLFLGPVWYTAEGYIHDWGATLLHVDDGGFGGFCASGKGSHNIILEHSEISLAGPSSSGEGNSGVGARNVPIIRYNKIHGTPNGILGGGSQILGNHIHNITDSFDPDMHKNGIEVFQASTMAGNVVHDVAAGVSVLFAPTFVENDPERYPNGPIGGVTWIFNNIMCDTGPTPLTIDELHKDPSE